MLDHIPPPRHPERPERLAAILRQLERSGQVRDCQTGLVRAAEDFELARIHSQTYVEQITSYEKAGGGLIEADTWVNPGSNLAARLGAGSTIEAVRSVMRSADPLSRRALCLVRPPGHHARPAAPMGFCIFANVAIAAAAAIAEFALDRILIVDWDVHHGNGTQESFYTDGRVAFLSIHRYPFYPGTGAANETGSGAGLGQIKNVPMAFGVSRSEYISAFRSALERLNDRFKPQLVIISAGFDAHAEDPVGSLGLETEDFSDLTKIVLDCSGTHAGGRIVSVLEGGYNLPILAGCVAAHLEALGVEPHHSI